MGSTEGGKRVGRAGPETRTAARSGLITFFMLRVDVHVPVPQRFLQVLGFALSK
jgi:hypothetical protein